MKRLSADVYKQLKSRRLDSENRKFALDEIYFSLQVHCIPFVIQIKCVQMYEGAKKMLVLEVPNFAGHNLFNMNL